MQNHFSTEVQPILLATHGMRDTDAAVGVAFDLSRDTGRPVKVVAVLEPAPIAASAYSFVVPVQAVWEDRREALLERVRKQINDAIGNDPGWPIDILTGSPPSAIADVAALSNAALIVMGLGRHALIDRALGSETTLHTLRCARTPVLAIPDAYAGTPTRAVVGSDFSATSLAAAQRAMALLPDLTRIVLVQVAPRWDLQPGAYAGWRAEYERAVAPGLEWLVRELAAPASVTVTTEIREGKPTQELLTAAGDYAADVIVVGSKGLGFLDRMLVGSTASAIIRSAQIAVFALPIAALAKQASQPADEEVCAVGA